MTAVILEVFVTSPISSLSRALNVGNPSKAPRASAWTSGCYWEVLGTYKIWASWVWLRSLETCSQNERMPVFVVSAAHQFLLRSLALARGSEGQISSNSLDPPGRRAKQHPFLYKVNFCATG